MAKKTKTKRTGSIEVKSREVKDGTRDIVIVVNGGKLIITEACYTGCGKTYEELKDLNNLAAFIMTIGVFLKGDKAVEALLRIAKEENKK